MEHSHREYRSTHHSTNPATANEDVNLPDAAVGSILEKLKPSTVSNNQECREACHDRAEFTLYTDNPPPHDAIARTRE